MSLRGPAPKPAAPVRFQPFELPGEILPPDPTAVPTSRPVPTTRPKPTAAAPVVKPQASQKPAPPPTRTVVPSPPPVATAPTSGGGPANNTAVLIGLNKADGSDPLQGMVEDTKIMRDMLLRSGYKSANIKVLTDKHATKSAILSALDWLASRTSGKGLAVVSISSHSGVSGGDMTFATGGGGRVSRHDLATRLAKVRGRLWTTISTCYSGTYAVAGITGSNRIAVFTASPDELSYQNAAGSVTIVYMVRRAMIEKAIRSVEDAYAWAKSELAKVAPEKTPILKDGIPGDVVVGQLQ